MQRYRYSDYSNPEFTNSLFAQGLDNGRCEVVLADAIKETSTRVAILNFIMWECLTKYGIVPTLKEFMVYKSITTDSISTVHSKYYQIMLEKRPDVPHMDFVATIFQNINRFYNIICRYMNAYMPSIDALGLAKLCENEEVKKLIEYKIDDKLGTKAAEQIIKAEQQTLIGLISKPDALKDNILYPYMLAQTLKKNQIPQMLLKYGPRSDVDDTMCRHVINESSFSGNKTVDDFAIESLSAKKSMYFNKSVIKISQYFNRKTRLAGAALPRLYPGSCGSTVTVPFYLKPEFSKNILERTIIDDGKEVVLTNANVSAYVGKTVNLVSIFGCRHTDGFCERCAGYRYFPDKGYGLLKFLPDDIHIGLLCVSHLMSRVTQKILSNKHLIATNSKTYTLPELTAMYLYNDNDSNLFWSPNVTKRIRNCSIRIPADSMGQISDLILDVLPNAEGFSKISYIDIMKGDDVVETLYLEANGFIPYLSTEMLEYMREKYGSIEYKDNGFVVDMSKFDMKKPVMGYTVLNDDMLSYVLSVRNFLVDKINNYNSVSRCISAFADVVYHKSEINLFYLEVILRALNITSETDYHIPQLIDTEHTYFGKLDTVVSESSISMKLAHEKLNRFLANPGSSLKSRKSGLFGPFFGLV